MKQMLIFCLFVVLTFQAKGVAMADDSFYCQEEWQEPGTAIILPLWWSHDGRLAFTCTANGEGGIYVWDGATLTNISEDIAFYYGIPRWSNDGRIAFLGAGEDRIADIYVWDGTALTNISQSPDISESNLLWSNDGRLVFKQNVEGSCLDLWDGTTIYTVEQPLPTFYCTALTWSTDGQLVIGSPMMSGYGLHIWQDGETTDIPSEFLFDGETAWSNDGRLALTQYEHDPNAFADHRRIREIMVWDGEQLINVSQSIYTNDQNPVWSDDGRLAFVSVSGDTWSNNRSVHVWDGETVISPEHNRTIFDNYPVWSNSGRLAFASVINGSSEIVVWDGEQTINVSQTPATNEREPVWSSNEQLAFSATARYATQGEIYVWDGANVTNISRSVDADDYAPRWSDDGRLAFLSLRESSIEIYVWDGTQLIEVTAREE